MYIKKCDVCLALKLVKHKPYGNLESLPVLTHWWKDISIDFVIGLPISINWKGEIYDSILVIINRLTQMIHYEQIMITINTLGLIEVIIDMVIQYYSLPNSIITDWDSLFNSKSGHLHVISLESSKRFQQSSICRPMARQNDKRALWRSTFELLLTINKMIKWNFSQ